jgi:hypothetical protein
MTTTTLTDPVSGQLRTILRTLKLGKLPGHPARADHPGQTTPPPPR